RSRGEQEELQARVERADVDGGAEDKEEQRAEQVAEVEEALLDLLARGGPGEHDSRHQGADSLREAELLGERRHPDDEGDGEEEEELPLQRLQEPFEQPREPAGRGKRDGDERESLTDERERLRAG